MPDVPGTDGAGQGRTERQTDRQAGRQADRQKIDRETDKQTGRQESQTHECRHAFGYTCTQLTLQLTFLPGAAYVDAYLTGSYMMPCRVL